jgi:hypothetical protein
MHTDQEGEHSSRKGVRVRERFKRWGEGASTGREVRIVGEGGVVVFIVNSEDRSVKSGGAGIKYRGSRKTTDTRRSDVWALLAGGGRAQWTGVIRGGG